MLSLLESFPLLSLRESRPLLSLLDSFPLLSLLVSVPLLESPSGLLELELLLGLSRLELLVVVLSPDSPVFCLVRSVLRSLRRLDRSLLELRLLDTLDSSACTDSCLIGCIGAP